MWVVSSGFLSRDCVACGNVLRVRILKDSGGARPVSGMQEPEFLRGVVGRRFGFGGANAGETV